MDELAYLALLRMRDGTAQEADMGVPGWDAALTEGVSSVTLIGKEDSRATLTVQIPEGARPMVKSRVKALVAGVQLRIYGVGYCLDGVTVWAWLLPDRSVEVGEDSLVADLMLARMAG